jgi:hypothetical protein
MIGWLQALYFKCSDCLAAMRSLLFSTLNKPCLAQFCT